MKKIAIAVFIGLAGAVAYGYTTIDGQLQGSSIGPGSPNYIQNQTASPQAASMSISGSATVGDPSGNVSTATTAALNLFVDPTGNDGNACTASGTSACLTIQGAVNKVPKRIRHGVTISVAAGTYSAGAYIEGFTYECGVVATAGCWLKIAGTMVASTLASGFQSGTVASATAGGVTTVAGRPTITVTGAGWTASDLRNRFLQITAGPGAGSIFPIYGNTATVITVADTWVTTPTAASSFAIVDSGSTITSGVTLPVSQFRLDFGLTSPASTGFAGFLVQGNGGVSSRVSGTTVDDTATSSLGSNSLLIENFNFSGVTRSLVARNSRHIAFAWNQITGAVTSTQIASILLTDSEAHVVASTASALAAGAYMVASYGAHSGTALQPAYTTLEGNVVTGGGLYQGHGMVAGQLFANMVKTGNASSGVVALSGGSQSLLVSGTAIEGNSTGPCVGIQGRTSANGPAAPGYIDFASGEFDNCTADAVLVDGRIEVISGSGTPAMSGSGSTGFGFNLKRGARLFWQSTNVPTVTGTGGDISIDGTTVTFVQATANGAIARSTTGTGVYSTTSVVDGPFILSQIATASLPAASAANKAGVAYDSTLNALTFSNGTAWASVGNTYTVGTFNNTSTANALDITGTVLAAHAADATNPGALSSAADQVINPGSTNKQFSGSGKLDFLVSAGTQPVAIGASGNQQLSFYRTTSSSAPYTWLEDIRIKFSDGTMNFGGLGDLNGFSPDFGNGDIATTGHVSGGTFCASASSCVTPGSTWTWASGVSLATSGTGTIKVGGTGATAVSFHACSAATAYNAGSTTLGSDTTLGNVTVTGCALGDAVSIGLSADMTATNGTYIPSVTGAGTMTAVFYTAGTAINPASVNVTLCCTRG